MSNYNIIVYIIKFLSAKIVTNVNARRFSNSKINSPPRGPWFKSRQRRIFLNDFSSFGFVSWTVDVFIYQDHNDPISSSMSNMKKMPNSKGGLMTWIMKKINCTQKPYFIVINNALCVFIPE